MLQGDYRTLFRGSGLDLADLREYQPNDDVRHIDWNVTARLQVPHVRLHNEDREVTSWFLLDLSPSVDFGSTYVKKRVVLSEFTAVLMRLLTRRGNSVGAIFYNGQVSKVIPPRSTRQHVLHVLSELENQPELTESPATDLTHFLTEASRIIRRRSLVFLLSDFISTPGWEDPLSHLGANHDMLAVRLIDPLDLELPDLGFLVIRDSETGEQVMVDTHDKGFRKRFARIAEERETTIRRGLQSARVDTLELSTADDLTDAVMRYAAMRKQRGRLSGGAITTMGAAGA
jgi:uncharacterized protein (DUF58 family)